MPSSKRNKLGESLRHAAVPAACPRPARMWLLLTITRPCAVTLSKVKKKTREWKGGLIVSAHKLLEE